MVLNDFGVYRGKNEFDFRTTPEKPMILCGGRNGAGKTTLFDSIMLCLYGKESFENKMNKKQYLETVSRYFHRFLGTKKSVDESSVILEFQFAHEGKISEYQIMRMWQNDDGKISENLRISQKTDNGKFIKLDAIQEFQWQTFIDQLIPRGVAKLFFFDGEKIQNIADEGNDCIQIKSSFDILLGLDLVEQLNLDIGMSIIKKSKGNNKKIIEDIKKLTKQKEESEKKLKRYFDKRIRFEEEIRTIQNNILLEKDKFSKLGGNYNINQQQLETRKTELNSNLSHITDEIRALCSDILPFSLIPKQLDEIQKVIEKDQKKIQSSFEKNILEKTFKDILDEINSKNNIADKTQTKFLKHLSLIFEKKLDLISKSTKTVFDLSQKDMIIIFETINKVNLIAKEKLFSLAQSYEQDSDSLQKTEVGLESIGIGDEIVPLMAKLEALNKKLGMLEKELDTQKNKEYAEKSLITIVNSQIRDLLTKKYTNLKEVTNLKLASKVQDVLADYSKLLRKKKLELLEKYIAEGLKTLLHKKDFIEKVSIDEETFKVKLFKGNDDEITKNMLSKGELQIYATAILWGLAKTSGRPLPFMIDTPLARLDDEHRNSLVEQFYPYASHQIIIFSTNSEINSHFYSKLEPFINNSFVIKYDSDDGKTVKHDGYFFNKNGEKYIEI